MRAFGLFPFLCFAAVAAAEAPSYTRDIVPLFAKHCTGCHAGAAKMGGLDLDTYGALSKGGKHGPAVVAGKSADSRLYQMVTGALKPLMPMGGEKLAAGELELIRQWIDGGASGPAPGEAPAPLSQQSKAPDIKPLKPVGPQIFALAYAPGGKGIAAAGFREVRWIDTATNRSGAAFSGAVSGVRAVAFSPDGTLLAGVGGMPGQQGEIILWNVASHEVARKWNGHSDNLYAVAFSPDGRLLATAGYDKLIKLWDPATGKEVRTLKDHIDAIYALQFTPDGKRLISGAADRTIKVWDPATGERLYTLSEPADAIHTVAISPDGKTLAAAGADKTIRLWTLEDKGAQLRNTLIAHEDQILKLAWSPDGQTIASASADKRIKVFHAADLTEIKTIGPQPDWTYGLAFAPDGRTLAAGRYDGSFSIYDAQKFVDLAETRRAAR